MGFLWGEKKRTPYLQPRPLLRRAEQHGRRRARLVEAGVLEELVSVHDLRGPPPRGDLARGPRVA